MIRARNAYALIKETIEAWSNDHVPSMGAALAYYTMFSAAPLLLIVVSVAGLVFGEEAARGEIFSQLQGLMGEKGAAAMQGLLQSVNRPRDGAIGTLIGVGVLFVGATTVFAELQDSLDRIWRAPVRENTSGVWALFRARVLSFGMILGIGFLLMVSLVVSAAIAALGKWWAPLFGGWELLAQAANFGLSFGLITVIFALIYKTMPRVHVAWRDVWIGAAVTSMLFSIGKLLIGLYIGKSSVTSGFGAAGSLAVVLLWVYYSAQIFLMGAAFTWVYAHRLGSRRGEPLPGAIELGATASTSGLGAAKPPLAASAAPVDRLPEVGRLQDARSASL